MWCMHVLWFDRFTWLLFILGRWALADQVWISLFSQQPDSFAIVHCTECTKKKWYFSLPATNWSKCKSCSTNLKSFCINDQLTYAGKIKKINHSIKCVTDTVICIDKGKNLLVLDMEKSTYGKISRGDYGLSSHTDIVLVCKIYTASYGGPHSYISSGLFFFLPLVFWYLRFVRLISQISESLCSLGLWFISRSVSSPIPFSSQGSQIRPPVRVSPSV
jgi:ribosomal protein S27E